MNEVVSDKENVRMFSTENRLSTDCLMSLRSVIGETHGAVRSNILSLISLLGKDFTSGA